MKAVSLICAGLLILALFNLPIGYYTFLRLAVTIGAVAIVFREFQRGFNAWVILFGLTAILFNPILPIYLNNKSAWMPIDIIVAILFLVKALSGFKKKKET
jgi:membrane-bound ClpP family serine protease